MGENEAKTDDRRERALRLVWSDLSLRSRADSKSLAP